MAFTKITEADLKNKGVIGLPDTPNLSQTDMQEKFDEIALDVLVPKFNELIDALEAASASGSLGIMDGEDESDVQTVIDNLKIAVSNIGTLAHTHENKAALDTITSTLLNNIDSVLLMLSGITSVASTVSNSPSAIPTCRAIVNYVSMLGGGDMLKSEYDSNSDGTVDDSDKLGGELPSYYQKATDTDLDTTDKTTTGAINEVFGAVGDVADDLSDFEDVYDESAGGDTIETIGQQSIGTYDIGELFVADDHYVYKATAIIAVGNVLSNSNCTKTNIKAEINSANTALINKVSKFVGGGYVPVDSIAYDETNKKLGLKVNGADTVIPFKSGGVYLLASNIGSGNFNVASKYPNYANLTVDNFLIKPKVLGGYANTGAASQWDKRGNADMSYNPNTGILSMTFYKSLYYRTGDADIRGGVTSFDLYLVECEIETL